MQPYLAFYYAGKFPRWIAQISEVGKQPFAWFCARLTECRKRTKFSDMETTPTAWQPVAHEENVHRGGFIQWLMVVICIWCALFVTSQFEVIFIFLNQRLGQVCWHNMHALLRHTFPCFMCHCTECKLSALRIRISEENKLNATIQQLITAKITGCTLKQE